MNYEFVEGDTKTLDNGIVVKRIKRLDKISKVNNIDITGFGKLGGYIESEANLLDDAWIDENSVLYGDMKLTGLSSLINTNLRLDNDKQTLNDFIKSSLFSQIIILQIVNCPNLSKLDLSLCNLNRLSLYNQSNFSLKIIPPSLKVIALDRFSSIINLPHLAKQPIVLDINTMHMALCKTGLKKYQCGPDASLTDKLKAIWQFQDFLIESDEFLEEEYTI